jgi:hypothetical protein
MEQLLTLLIAVGGIATGIGAIWAAVVARRQAQVTERSLTEQGRSLREQNERTRLSLESDLLDRLDERFSGERLLDRRRRLAKYIKENFIVDDDIQEVKHFNNAASEVFHFFEVAGQLTKAGAVEAETVFVRYGWWIWSY